MSKINIQEKLDLFNEMYVPKIVGELNGQYVKLAKFKGPYVMHQHDNEDEMFFVIKGEFDMEYPDRVETIREGEFIIIPKGTQHRPNAKEEVHIMLFEPTTVVNTGNAGGEHTIQPSDLERI